ncbi:MAG: DUF1499 domain-containing protein [Chloroflexota bacterium]
MRILLIVVVVLVILAIVLVVGGRSYVNNSPRPKKVGNGTMAPCPDSPNCVSSKSTNDIHKIEPFEVDSDGGGATLDRLQQVIQNMESSAVITKTDDYLYAEFRSPFWRFVDDVEFFAESDVVHVRSASRLGYSDMGVNRKRVESIRRLMTNS